MKQPDRIVLANEPRLLRDLLTRTLGSSQDLEIAGEIHDLADLSNALERLRPHWVVLSMSPKGELPENAEAFVAEHPSVSILAVASDGSAAKIRCTDAWMWLADNLSRDELVRVLHRTLTFSSSPQ